MSDPEARYEVLVIGAGNAGLAAAISAAESGAKVALLEKATKDLRGGNTYFTGGDLRFGWSSLDDDVLPLIGSISENEIKQMREMVTPYTQEKFYEDIMRVTEGYSNPELLQQLVSESLPTIKWLRSLGHVWYPSYDEPGASVVVTMNGGGARLSDLGFDVAAKMGVDIRYQNIVTELLKDKRGGINGAYVLTPEGYTKIYAKAVVLACGGFEANAAMRTAYLGEGWDRVKVRGVPFNTGDGLRAAWDIGAQSYGNLSGCHATPQDIDRPAFSVRIGPALEYRRHGYPWGVMVNVNGQRFVDEGSDMRAYTYAKTGKAIMLQPQGVAYQIFDKKTAHLPKGYSNATGAQANTLQELAAKLGLEPAPFVKTIEDFNRAVQPGTFDHRDRDGKCTRGLAINKSNWASPIDTPPYHGYGVCCGITFTFGGLRINTSTQVLSNWEAPIPGLFACGEIAGGFFYMNYAGGSGLMQGATYGRLAGRNAAKLAKAA
jgi:tricarballylate dehydrogenase